MIYKTLQKRCHLLRLALAGTDNRELMPKEIACRLTLLSVRDHTSHHETNEVSYFLCIHVVVQSTEIITVTSVTKIPRYITRNFILC